MIYGANGFTGHLVAVEAKRQGLCPVLAGRRAGPIEALPEDLGMPARVFDIGHPQAAAAALSDMAVVSHCAGPFSATSAQTIDACLATRTHYVDITGELEVFRAAQRRHADAQATGIAFVRSDQPHKSSARCEGDWVSVETTRLLLDRHAGKKVRRFVGILRSRARFRVHTCIVRRHSSRGLERDAEKRDR
jgi:NADP-dependent 3-hydroxy acid dehydrogenase YdfG